MPLGKNSARSGKKREALSSILGKAKDDERLLNKALRRSSVS